MDTREDPGQYYPGGSIIPKTPVKPSGGGAVDSVNGQTGAVVLTADDVGALPATPGEYGSHTIAGKTTFSNTVQCANIAVGEESSASASPKLGAVALGRHCRALGEASTAGGHRSVTTNQAKYGFAFGNRNYAAEAGAIALGYQAWATRTGEFENADSDVAVGVTFKYKYTFVWQGKDDTNPGYYHSHGDGSFNVNPIGGAAAFWIGEQNLPQVIAKETNDKLSKSGGTITGAIVVADASNSLHSSVTVGDANASPGRVVVNPYGIVAREEENTTDPYWSFDKNSSKRIARVTDITSEPVKAALFADVALTSKITALAEAATKSKLSATDADFKSAVEASKAGGLTDSAKAALFADTAFTSKTNYELFTVPASGDDADKLVNKTVNLVEVGNATRTFTLPAEVKEGDKTFARDFIVRIEVAEGATGGVDFPEGLSVEGDNWPSVEAGKTYILAMTETKANTWLLKVLEV